MSTSKHPTAYIPSKKSLIDPLYKGLSARARKIGSALALPTEGADDHLLAIRVDVNMQTGTPLQDGATGAYLSPMLCCLKCQGPLGTHAYLVYLDRDATHELFKAGLLVEIDPFVPGERVLLALPRLFVLRPEVIADHDGFPWSATAGLSLHNTIQDACPNHAKTLVSQANAIRAQVYHRNWWNNAAAELSTYPPAQQVTPWSSPTWRNLTPVAWELLSALYGICPTCHGLALHGPGTSNCAKKLTVAPAYLEANTYRIQQLQRELGLGRPTTPLEPLPDEVALLQELQGLQETTP